MNDITTKTTSIYPHSEVIEMASPSSETHSNTNVQPLDTLGHGSLSLAQLGLCHSPSQSISDYKTQDLVHDHLKPLKSQPSLQESLKSISSFSSTKLNLNSTSPIDNSRQSSYISGCITNRFFDRVRTTGDIECEEHRSQRKLLRNIYRSGKNNSNPDNIRNKHSDSLDPNSFSKRNNVFPNLQETCSFSSLPNTLTRFTYASKKRNEEFHSHFKSVPMDDFLLDDFSCAYSKEILIQGRMYVSERHICFSANILGWQTNHVIAFDEILSLEKKTTAGLFPNGIVIQTLHSTYIYASFISRDTTFVFINTVWKQNSQEVVSGEESDCDEFDEEPFETNTDEDDNQFTDERNSIEINNNGQNTDSFTDVNAKWSVQNLGPETHPMTNPCYDPESVNERLLCKEIIPAPIGVVANLLFGKESILTEYLKEQNCFNISSIDSLGENKRREYSYVKPLNTSIGPKQTKCICTDDVEVWNNKSTINIVTTTLNSDVPSGNAFHAKTRYILSWAANNHTQIMISCWIDWKGKSWIKSAIEKGANEGQQQYVNDLIPFLLSRLKLEDSKRLRSINVDERSSSIKRKKYNKHKHISSKREISKKSKFANSNFEIVKNAWSRIPILGLIPFTTSFALSTSIIAIWFIMTLFYTQPNTIQKFDFAGLSDTRNLEIFVMEEEYYLWKWLDDRIDKTKNSFNPFFVSHEDFDSNELNHVIF